MLSVNMIIEEALGNLQVGNELVEVAFLFYEGHGEPYVVYSEINKDRTYAADNLNEGFFTNIDFQVYSKGNYLPIIEEILSRLERIGFIYEPDRDSSDMYDRDTKYYHKTICLAYPLQRERTGNQDEAIVFPIDYVTFPLPQQN